MSIHTLLILTSIQESSELGVIGRSVRSREELADLFVSIPIRLSGSLQWLEVMLGITGSKLCHVGLPCFSLSQLELIGSKIHADAIKDFFCDFL